MTHAVIVNGMLGDGSPHGTSIFYLDPADGAAKTMAFDRFQSKFESAAGKADIQVVTAR